MNFNELEGKELYEAYSNKVAEMAKHYDNPSTEDVNVELKALSYTLATISSMHANEMVPQDEINDALKFLAGDVSDAVDILDEVFAERPDQLTSEYIKILEELRMMRLKTHI